MRYGIRQHGGASCLISAFLAVPERMRKDIRELSKLECKITERGQGHATELMESICKEADSKRMILVLTVGAFGDDAPMNAEQLADWYATFDFNTLQKEPLMLVRMFNPFPESGLTAKIGQIITEGL